MIKYPRIYSFSTVGIIMHFNQDYLLHSIRTDFTGKNGIGKSLIADLFQILFISDKQKIAFGTESFKNNTRLLHTLPYKTSDAYIFINIEVEKDSFITLGVNIPNKKSRPLKSFWILNKAHGINDNNELSDLSIAKNNIPFFKDFIHDNSIPPIEKLAIKLRDEKQIKAIELRITDIISTDVGMSRNYELLSSLKGVGFVVACQLIYHTGNFTRFSSWRAFSSYCGTAPFEYSSGTSIHRRKQCHYLGDRKMKSLLSMASVSAIQHDSELWLYYKRKLAEGKDKMIAINNVRNKLIARAFAVVKRGTPYVVLQQHAA